MNLSCCFQTVCLVSLLLRPGGAPGGDTSGHPSDVEMKSDERSAASRGLTATARSFRRRGDELQFEFSLALSENAAWMIKPLETLRITYFDDRGRQQGEFAFEHFPVDARFLRAQSSRTSTEIVVRPPRDAREMTIEFGAVRITKVQIPSRPER